MDRNRVSEGVGGRGMGPILWRARGRRPPDGCHRMLPHSVAQVPPLVTAGGELPAAVQVGLGGPCQVSAAPQKVGQHGGEGVEASEGVGAGGLWG